MRVLQLNAARPRPCIAATPRRSLHRPLVTVRAAGGDSEALPAGLTAAEVGTHQHCHFHIAWSWDAGRFNWLQATSSPCLVLCAMQAYEVLGLPNADHTFDQVRAV